MGPHSKPQSHIIDGHSSETKVTAFWLVKSKGRYFFRDMSDTSDFYVGWGGGENSL